MSLDTQALGSLFEMSRDAVIGVENETIVFANPAAEALLSLRAGDPAARHIPEHILSDPSQRFVATARLGARALELSVVRSGSLTLLCIARGAKDSVSAPWSRTLSELGSDLFSARLAIDAIVGGTNAEQKDDLKSYAAVLYQSYYRMKRLHDHMLLAGSILRDELPFSPRMISLAELCRALCATVEPLVRPSGIDLSFSGGDDPCDIMADAPLMETMLLNLLSNSLLHAASGDSIRMTLSENGARYVIAVDDRGRGIRPERMAAILAGSQAADMTDPAAGAGLGLVIARGIAEKHGGALIMESREDKGTSLRISLPRPNAQDAARLHQSEAFYRTDGMDAVLTELSVVLDKRIYNHRMFD